jgi:DNA-binding NarL/FixJ family response regulator
MAGKLAAGVRNKTEDQKLSSREQQTLEFLSNGLANAEIARQISVELITVKTHIHHLLGKLGVKNRTEATFLARRHLLRT